jgi:CubicO group peptidase (beta-lactamase class C family)
MRTKKILNRIVLFLLFAAIGYGIYYCWFSFPIISGYSAKNACSCAFIQARTKDSIAEEELGSFPLSLGSIAINEKDSSVTGTVWGMAKRKAIYRNGFGCTLVNELSESAIRNQKISVPQQAFIEDSIRWPLGDDFATRMITNNSRSYLDSAISFVFKQQYHNKKVYTRAVVVLQNGAIVAEQYGQGYNKNSKFLGWSMAKSITGALIGILVKGGKLNVAAPAPVTAWKNTNDNRHAITLENLLQQTSGLDFNENYNSYSNATNMLFKKADMAGYTASLPLKTVPGSEFYYSSGNSNILSGIVRTTVGEKDYHAFPHTALFHKLGMYHTLLEPDASGTFVGSSYIYASARDYARFGLLYLNNGVANGEQILPEDWVRKTVIPSTVNKLKNYGYQFWLNGLDPNDASKKEFSEAPADMFYADGYGGQRIYIIPSLQLVIVRMGLNKFDEHQFLKILLSAFVKQPIDKK